MLPVLYCFFPGDAEMLAASKPTAAAESADDPAKRTVRCTTIGEFYSAAARSLVGQMIRPFLDQLVITQIEMLHSVRNQQRLDGAGTLLRDAIEKAGAMQARAVGESAPARIRELHDLITNLMIATRQAETQPLPPLREGALSATLQGLRSAGPADQYSIRVYRVLTEFLSGARTWSEKLDKVVGLAEEVSEADLLLIDPLLGEVLQCEMVQDNLFGRRISVEDRLDDLIELYRGVYPERKKAPASEISVRLVALLRRLEMPETRAAIENTVLQMLNGRDQFCSPELLTELKGIYGMLAKLRFGERLIGGKRALEFIDKRIGRLLTAEAVTDYIRGGLTLGDRMLLLFDIYAATFGPSNRRHIEEVIDRYFSSDDFGRRLLSIEGAPQHKMKVMTQVYRAVAKSTLPSATKTNYARTVIKMQADFVGESNFFAAIDRKFPNTAKKALHVIRLCHDSCFIPGINLDRAKTVIHHFIGRPDFMERYLEGAKGPAQVEMIRSLKQQLAPLGIDLPL